MAKTKPGKYSIDEYTLNKDFMTDKEIEEMYALLKKHMFIKYGNWDEDVIHRTILRGLWKADMYNPKKASKIVWFQSILRFIYLAEVDPNYNKVLGHLRLDDPLGTDEGSASWHDVIGPEEVDDSELEKIQLVQKITKILEEGDYPYLRLRSQSLSYDQICEILNCNHNMIWNNLKVEKARLNDELNKEPELLTILKGRTKHHYSIKKLPGVKYIKGDGSGRKYKKVDKAENEILKRCLMCDSCFIATSNKKTCNLKCGLELKKKREKDLCEKKRRERRGINI